MRGNAICSIPAFINIGGAGNGHRFAFSTKQKIIVVTSVCTAMGSIPITLHISKQRLPVGVAVFLGKCSTLIECIPKINGCSLLAETNIYYGPIRLIEMKLPCNIRHNLTPQCFTAVFFYMSNQNLMKEFVFISRNIQTLSDVLFFNKFIVGIISRFFL